MYIFRTIDFPKWLIEKFYFRGKAGEPIRRLEAADRARSRQLKGVTRIVVNQRGKS
jgi:hypothetical protein